MSELPPGWAETTLGEIAETRLGKMLSKKAKIGNGSRPYLRNKNVQWGRIDVDDVLEMDFANDELERFRVLTGDLLVCEGGEVGRAAIWRGQLDWIGYQKALHRVRPHGGIAPEYLLYVFIWLAQTNAFDRHVTGSTIKHLPQEDLRRLALPLPPLNEQRRIVAAIEEHLSRLDAADASLAAALRRLTPLRDHAFMAAGSDGWPTMPLGELLREPLRNGHSAKASHDGVVRTLTLSAVTRDKFTDENTKLTAADPEKVKSLWLEPGDILIERSNTPELVGTSALYSGPRDWAIFPDLLIRVRVAESLQPEFLEFVLKSRPTRRYFQRSAQGIAGSMPKVDQGAVERLEVPLPPLQEQRRIVQEVEERLSRIDAMRASIERAQRRSAALRAAQERIARRVRHAYDRRGRGMGPRDEIFRVTDRWGNLIVLTVEDWQRITTKRPGVEGYVEQVQETLERPSMVFEGRYEDSKVFYREGLLDDDPLYKACYVATIVRYSGRGDPATIRTVYFPFHVQGALGRLLHVER